MFFSSDGPQRDAGHTNKVSFCPKGLGTKASILLGGLRPVAKKSPQQCALLRGKWIGRGDSGVHCVCRAGLSKVSRVASEGASVRATRVAHVLRYTCVQF